MPRSPRTRLAGIALTAVALAGACGTSDPEPTARADEATGAVTPGCDDVATSEGPVELTDHFGRTVELDRPAERVAVLEWQQVEDVLTLCLTPVAVADPEGYRLWNTAEELPATVPDVGGRGEPNLDAIYATEPDLVILEATSPDDEIIGMLEQRDVPVLATQGADGSDPIAHMVGTFELIAEAVGREERAAQVVEELEAHIQEAKAAVADTDIDEFVYFDGWVQGGNVAIRPFGQGSLMGELGEALGLRNAWTGEVDPAYGLGQTDIEGMTSVGDATFFHTGTDDPAYDLLDELEDNRIWTSLPAVAEGRTHAFPPGIWTFGGPRSAQQAIDAYVDLLTG